MRLVPVRLVLLLACVGVIALLVAKSFEWSTRPNKGLEDWGSFVASGRAANAGENPYGVYPLTFRVGITAAPAPNLNPPISVYPLRVAGHLNADLSHSIVYALSMAGFVFCVLLLASSYRDASPLLVVWSFAMAGLWHTLEVGQIYVPLMVATTGAWLLLRRNEDDWRAGLLTGFIAAVKPQFILWPVLLLAARKPKAAAGGFASAAALSVFPLLLDGPTIYRQWLDATPPLIPAQVFPGNSSILAMMGRLGHPHLGILLTGAMVVACLAWAAWRRPGALEVSAVAIIASLLAGPITWGGYTIMLLPVFFAAGIRRTWPAAILLSVPFWWIVDNAPGSQMHLFLVGSIYGFGIIALAAGVAAGGWRLRRSGEIPTDRAPEQRPAVAPAAGG